jgi:hypothetical protein
MNHQGRFTKSVIIDKVMTPKIAKSEYSINNKSLRLLSELLSTHTITVDGILFWDIEQRGLLFSEVQLQIPLIVLTLIRYVSRMITEDYNGNTTYGFIITNSDIECLLKNEQRLDKIIKEENVRQQYQ